MYDADAILKLIKDNLSATEKEYLKEKLNEVTVREGKPKYCSFCSCVLWMAIEKKHKCCWDCHYEGKDQPEQCEGLSGANSC